MNIELLYESEVSDQQNDFNVEALEILKSLGLDAQIALYQKEGGETKAFKYREATKEQMFVYLQNFQTVCLLEKFDAEAIPYRVLEILKDAKETNRFTYFGIMYDRANIKEDPILYGVIKEGYSHKFYLLARWGDALAPYSELKKKAFTLYYKSLENVVAKLAAELKNIAELAKAGAVPNVSLDYSNVPRISSLSQYLSSPFTE
jgi:hypothetical protein